MLILKKESKDITKNDFLFKMSIALKEANETEYWLEFLIQSELLSDNDANGVLQHCKEICRILDSIIET